MKLRLMIKGSIMVAAFALAFASSAFDSSRFALAGQKRICSPHGLPKGQDACIARLKEMAGSGSALLNAYSKGPETIINCGLLWHNSKSPCDVGRNNQSMRMKIFALSNAWQLDNAAEVHRLLATEF